MPMFTYLRSSMGSYHGNTQLILLFSLIKTERQTAGEQENWLPPWTGNEGEETKSVNLG